MRRWSHLCSCVNASPVLADGVEEVAAVERLLL